VAPGEGAADAFGGGELGIGGDELGIGGVAGDDCGGLAGGAGGGAANAGTGTPARNTTKGITSLIPSANSTANEPVLATEGNVIVGGR
jgi:hypothetical protein